LRYSSKLATLRALPPAHDDVIRNFHRERIQFALSPLLEQLPAQIGKFKRGPPKRNSATVRLSQTPCQFSRVNVHKCKYSAPPGKRTINFQSRSQGEAAARRPPLKAREFDPFAVPTVISHIAVSRSLGEEDFLIVDPFSWITLSKAWRISILPPSG
jgi:hypothetical protein